MNSKFKKGCKSVAITPWLAHHFFVYATMLVFLNCSLTMCKIELIQSSYLDPYAKMRRIKRDDLSLEKVTSVKADVERATLIR